MVLHQYKLIFIHVPKCAGSSIETAFGVAPFDWRSPDYEHCVGWCPVRSIHMQHATPRQLIELDLVDRAVFDEYHKFAVVRNPTARAISDYNWLMKDLRIRDSFKNYIHRKGKFQEALVNDRIPTYRGDHVKLQSDFLELDGEPVIDSLLRLEQLSQDWAAFCEKLGLDLGSLPNVKGDIRKRKASLNAQERKWVEEKYAKDYELLGYPKA